MTEVETEPTEVEPRPWAVVGASHAGITVSHLDRALCFYHDLLGLDVIAERLFDEQYIFRIVDVPNTRAIRFALLRVPGSSITIELLEYRGCERFPAASRPCDPASGHLCLLVKGIDSMYERLSHAGVTARSDGPILVEAGPNQGGRSLYVLDPDGYHVELHERPEMPDARL